VAAWRGAKCLVLLGLWLQGWRPFGAERDPRSCPPSWNFSQSYATNARTGRPGKPRGPLSGDHAAGDGRDNDDQNAELEGVSGGRSRTLAIMADAI
jgi:hypothetical protein